jgi:NAD-dependent SIR2 family protein deacetylase
LIQEADAIAVFAGAGMSADSGLATFRGADGLWSQSIQIDGKAYSHLDLMTPFAFAETPKDAWEFIFGLKDKFDTIAPHDGYYKLLERIQHKEHFIVTSNIDEYFLKTGFDENRILEHHGSIYYMQCLDNKEKEVWLTPDLSKAQLQNAALPACPNCGGACRPNIRLFADWSWLPIRTEHQQARYNSWRKEMQALNKKIVVLEIGAGKTIRTIRHAAEDLASEHVLIRVNPDDYETKRANHLSIRMKAKDFLLSI